MKTGAKTRTTTTSDPPPHPVKPETGNQEDEDAFVNKGENDEKLPKLAEGFYEIEAIKKTRIRKVRFFSLLSFTLLLMFLDHFFILLSHVFYFIVGLWWIDCG